MRKNLYSKKKSELAWGEGVCPKCGSDEMELDNETWEGQLSTVSCRECGEYVFDPYDEHTMHDC